MSRRRYTAEFKIAAVRQVTVEGHSVLDVAKRLGVSSKSLYDWKKLYGESSEKTARASLAHGGVAYGTHWSAWPVGRAETGSLATLARRRVS